MGCPSGPGESLSCGTNGTRPILGDCGWNSITDWGFHFAARDSRHVYLGLDQVTVDSASIEGTWPAGRHGCSLVWDEARQRLVLFGGGEVSNDGVGLATYFDTYMLFCFFNLQPAGMILSDQEKISVMCGSWHPVSHWLLLLLTNPLSSLSPGNGRESMKIKIVCRKRERRPRCDFRLPNPFAWDVVMQHIM